MSKHWKILNIQREGYPEVEIINIGNFWKVYPLPPKRTPLKFLQMTELLHATSRNGNAIGISSVPRN
jgi:hypothetical protein